MFTGLLMMYSLFFWPRHVARSLYSTLITRCHFIFSSLEACGTVITVILCNVFHKPVGRWRSFSKGRRKDSGFSESFDEVSWDSESSSSTHLYGQDSPRTGSPPPTPPPRPPRRRTTVVDDRFTTPPTPRHPPPPPPIDSVEHDEVERPEPAPPIPPPRPLHTLLAFSWALPAFTNWFSWLTDLRRNSKQCV